jgi:prepilin-type N-terminal cleavage/methylation domain-containing protein
MSVVAWPSAAKRRARQRGLSLVELMVGLAIGLLVVAGATVVTASQLSDSRRLLVETQMQQDLRAAADIITRELRRSGSSAYSNIARNAIWSTASPTPTVNLYTGLNITTAPSGDEVIYSYYRTSGAVINPFGFKLDAGVIKSKIDGSVWQELTDSRVMNVTAFTVTQTDGPAVQMPCPKDCPGGGETCFPTWTVRELVVAITGQAVADASVVRSIRAVAKLRNDVLTPSAPGQVCPP